MTDTANDAPDRWRSGTSWEEIAGFSRAVRVGQMILVSGTTVRPDADGTVPHLGDSYAQTAEAFALALEGVVALGGSADTVYRTRMYLAPAASWQDASRAHHDAFGHVAPANSTVYVGNVVGDGLLVEVEIEASVL